ncbi:NADH-quinone reductase [Thalassotalea sp. HSM 43]|uniref:DUF6482 family protein n=1 Tax=Thalassotalea sp. HSM 43 TaxID=2552945 RepID=UPI001081CF68|nr:DUF6482 family protein [Thalassotalea sp. HSM 43]QBY05672.1 NADH-quinone reductase [Thalassotalea sp. HSM 43]
MDLTIKSFEGNIYLITENGAIVTGKDNNPLRFDSISEIKEYYRGNMPDRVSLEQHTPYDEMCGLQSSTEPLTLRLQW